MDGHVLMWTQILLQCWTETNLSATSVGTETTPLTLHGDIHLTLPEAISQSTSSWDPVMGQSLSLPFVSCLYLSLPFTHTHKRTETTVAINKGVNFIRPSLRNWKNVTLMRKWNLSLSLSLSLLSFSSSSSSSSSSLPPSLSWHSSENLSIRWRCRWLIPG